MHSEPRSVVAKILRQGYYWHTMHRDAKEKIEKCDSYEMHSPTEICMPAFWTILFNEARNEEEMRLNLDLIQERREISAIQKAKYKKKVEQYYNKRVRPVSFRVGDFVYQRNEASRVENQGKLGLN
nr:reverse transcriptase domain-containing protein [Tanacetum cinerariifolium]